MSQQTKPNHCLHIIEAYVNCVVKTPSSNIYNNLEICKNFDFLAKKCIVASFNTNGKHDRPGR
jgi:hypothetical protein